MTDASLGTWCISRADADAPPGHPGGSELPAPGCLVMRVAARALTSDTDTDGGRDSRTSMEFPDHPMAEKEH